MEPKPICSLTGGHTPGWPSRCDCWFEVRVPVVSAGLPDLNRKMRRGTCDDMTTWNVVMIDGIAVTAAGLVADVESPIEER